MCGIAGILSPDPRNVTRERLRLMTDVISHRGPDGEGQWISPNGNTGLGHRRLSIIDLSHEADQPMHYLDRYSIVFNGEIYNYLELKETLLKEGYSFRTASDTEVLMALFDRHRENCLGLLDGMFSFVLYDAVENRVFCARDRFGEKPFFYHYEPGKEFLFGSEMKCLWAGGLPRQSNKRMLFNYLAYGFLDNPSDLSETFYQGILRLPHAHYLSLDLNTFQLSIRQYYDIHWAAADGSITPAQASAKFNELFFTSVQRRLRSDVPVGSSLSGGLDSSLVVCAIDKLKGGEGQIQKTFSAVFPGFKKDERKYMDYVTARTRVEPHFVTPKDEDLIRDLETLAWHQEEPFGSASIYVQYCVMRLAKENGVTVLLDGQGADEILAGYHPYYNHFLNELRHSNPALHRRELKAYADMHSNSTINENVLKGWKHRVKALLPSQSTQLRKWYERYRHLRNPFLSNDFFHAHFSESFSNQYALEGLNHSLYASTMKRGLQELLRYADRNSMAHSREVRLPFLSHEVVDFLFTLPAEFKIHDGWTKWIMRETFKDLLPPEIAWRKDKIGYEPPQKSWMENPLIRDRVMDSREKLVQEGILSPRVRQQAYRGEEAVQGDNKNWKFLMVRSMIQ